MAETWPASATIRSESVTLSMQWCAGFFFATRMSITYLGFQSDPRAGSGVTAALGFLVLLSALLFGADNKSAFKEMVSGRGTVRWMNIYLVFIGMSLIWSQADSLAVAGVYWAGMVMDAATVFLLLQAINIRDAVEGLMKGFVLGAIVVAAIAWSAPTLPDMRIGHEEFLHPNALGLEFALAFLLAQHLSVNHKNWILAAIVLGASLLRTISKTSIAAVLVAELFYLVFVSQISKKAKVSVIAGTALTIAAFANLLQLYLDNYTANPNQVDSLTGRTAIWTMSILMGLERPWVGHGFYSFRALMPAFGSFQAWTAHNEVLQQFFEAGVVGVVLTAGLYISWWRKSWPKRKSPYGVLATTLIVFCFVHGLTDAPNFGLTIPFWLLVAVSAALAADRPQEEVPV